MNWLLDLGNTRLKLAPWVPGEPVGDLQALAHQAPGFDAALSDWLAGTRPGDEAWLASVAPMASTRHLEEALQAAGLRLRRVHSRACAGDVRVAYADPARFGVDRYLALLGARARGVGAWLVVSVGSAMTVDLIDASGRHHGGLIAPTPTHMHEALSARFPALPATDGEAVAFAADTADGVAGGCLAAAQGLVERSHREATARLGVAPDVLVTGGGAAPVARGLPFGSVLAPALVLEGLAVHAALAMEEDA